MKMLFNKPVAALAIVGILGVLVLRSFADPDPDQPPFPVEANAKFVLKIRNRHLAKDGDDAKAKKALQDQLDLGAYANGTQLHFRYKTGGATDEMLKPHHAASSKIDIKTDQVIVSATAKKAEEELTLIAPHVTQQVASNNLADITAVLNLLAPQ
ncbi:MAG: hypothetical protein ABJB69_01025 [Spartobacteria bacterium]